MRSSKDIQFSNLCDRLARGKITEDWVHWQVEWEINNFWFRIFRFQMSKRNSNAISISSDSDDENTNEKIFKSEIDA